jgi:hypothetical protein
MLWPREPLYVEPPPQVVIHVHLIVSVKTEGTSAGSALL